MPRVPAAPQTVVTESVAAAPIRAPLQPIRGAGVNVGGLVEGIDTARIALERGQLQVDQIQIQEADAALEVAWNDLLYTGKDAYYEKRGKIAFDSQEDTNKGLTDIASELSSGLTSGRQRRVFNNSVAKRLQKHLVNVGRHAFTQRQVWDADSASAGITSWLESATLDPSRVAEAETRITELVGVIQEKKLAFRLVRKWQIWRSLRP